MWVPWFTACDEQQAAAANPAHGCCCSAALLLLPTLLMAPARPTLTPTLSTASSLCFWLLSDAHALTPL